MDNPKENEKARLPILIIPGFMSSGLQVVRSESHPSWEGKKLWLSIFRLGFSSKLGKEKYEFKSADLEDLDIQLRNDWLNHMCLDSDLLNERPGVQIRAVPGLHGVDYLENNTIAKAQTYVFGPVIRALKKHGGYTEDHDLGAAPYDWRLSPIVLEERDHYFTRTIEQIELMRMNTGNPVILLCHSMGVKTGHYLMKFAKDKKGQEWIDKNIHTYMPVGGPILGASEALKSVIIGSKMGLPDALLSDHGALIMARSLGSTPWLLPISSSGKIEEALHKDIMCSPIIEKVDVITLVIKAVDTRKLCRKYPSMSEIRITVKHGEEKLSTDWYKPSSTNLINMEEVFEFPVRKDTKSDPVFEVFMVEKGLALEENRKKKRLCGCNSCGECLCCCLCCPCYCALNIVEYLLNCVYYTSKSATDKAMDIAGEGVRIKQASFKVKRFKNLENFKIALHNGKNYSSRHRRDAITSEATISIKWNQGTSLTQSKLGSNGQTPADGFAKHITIMHENALVVTSRDLLQLENLETLQSLWNSQHYQMNPYVSTEAPPVKRVHAVYGINCDTEVHSIYKRQARKVLKNKLQETYSINSDFALNKPTLERYGFIQKNGKISETKATPQLDVVSGKVVNKSGDGTVPYASLQFVQTWRDKCQVSVIEIEKVKHRDILSNSKFHNALLQYSCGISITERDNDDPETPAAKMEVQES